MELGLDSTNFNFWNNFVYNLNNITGLQDNKDASLSQPQRVNTDYNYVIYSHLKDNVG